MQFMLTVITLSALSESRPNVLHITHARPSCAYVQSGQIRAGRLGPFQALENLKQSRLSPVNMSECTACSEKCSLYDPEVKVFHGTSQFLPTGSSEEVVCYSHCAVCIPKQVQKQLFCLRTFHALYSK